MSAHLSVPPRRAARSEAEALLAEIPGWDDALLLHMRRRFETSRLFRFRHDLDAPVTPVARLLIEAADIEILERGLGTPDADNDA